MSRLSSEVEVGAGIDSEEEFDRYDCSFVEELNMTVFLIPVIWCVHQSLDGSLLPYQDHVGARAHVQQT